MILGLLIVSLAHAEPFTLSWDANVDPVDGYKVYQRGALGIYDPTAPLATLGPVTTYPGTVPDVTVDTTYYWVVTAFNSAGESGQSNEVSKLFVAPVPPPVADTTPPPVPMGVAVVRDSALTCVLSWLAVSAPDLAGYGVWASTTSGWYGGPIMTLAGTMVSCASMGIPANGATYYFQVNAYDAAGNQSAKSPEVSITLPAPAPRTCLKYAGKSGTCKQWSN